MMKRCWHSDPKERGTFDQIEQELHNELAEYLRDSPCNDYYQFVPIRDTEIGGVIKDCGLRMRSNSSEDDELIWRGSFNEKNDAIDCEAPQKRRFSC